MTDSDAAHDTGLRHRLAWWLLGGKKGVKRNFREIHKLARHVDEGRDDPYTGMRIESETKAIEHKLGLRNE